MEQDQKTLQTLQQQIEAAWQRLKLDAVAQELAADDALMAQPDFWQNPERAAEVSKRHAKMTDRLQPWQTLRQSVDDIAELAAAGDASLADEIHVQTTELMKAFTALQQELLYAGPYDNHDVIVRISAGVGGTDAQDWASMLERMYVRWAEKHGFSVDIVERSAGEEAGIKTSVMTMSGQLLYGKLKGEHGVHRLVRLSPFNSDNLRQTSFALVEILPDIDRPEDVDLNEKDLKIDVYRAGGHGGQSVNTTDSAVRVTHVPTGIVVAIQNERSQLQNKETALKILRSKLVQLQMEQHAENIQELQAGESANWGSQIRNYVLHPYTMVKDTRTKHEDRDAAGVLDGKIDGFIDAYNQTIAG